MTEITRRCATTDSFAAYGIDDGSDLIHAAARQLGETSQTVTVSDTSVAVVENAVRSAFVELADTDKLPPAVVAALDDATAAIRDTHGGESLDLR
ncbi:MAG: hypothetical protein ABEI99_07035, partial [Halobaculum sp.]